MTTQSFSMNGICDVCSRNTSDTIMRIGLILDSRRIARSLGRLSRLIWDQSIQSRWLADCIIGISDRLPESNTPLSFDRRLGIRLPKNRAEPQKPLLYRTNPSNSPVPGRLTFSTDSSEQCFSHRMTLMGGTTPLLNCWIRQLLRTVLIA